jgi:hypothetical protein
VGLEARKRAVEWVLAPHCHFIAKCPFNDLDLLVGVRDLLGQLERYDPVQVGMGETTNQTARAAGLAGRRSRLLAQNQLRQPQAETLLADAPGAMQKKGLR